MGMGPRVLSAGCLVALAFALTRAPDAKPKAAGDKPRACPAGMIRVKGGTFRMGKSPKDREKCWASDEEPAHDVTLDTYCIDKTEVTTAAYAKCVAAGACTAAVVELDATAREDDKKLAGLCNAGHADRAKHPINCVKWDQANAYCTWAGKRLPTEAEWEYAARGKDDRVYPWGNDPPTAKRLNGCGKECVGLGLFGMVEMYKEDDGWPATAPVGTFPTGASAVGALDMAGNVSEWTGDLYGPYAAEAQTNPYGAYVGEDRVRRGGSWGGSGYGGTRVPQSDDACQKRVSDRIPGWVNWRYSRVGFRCTFEVTPASGKLVVADKHRRDAVEHYKKSDYARAIEEFTKAYALDGSPKTLFNLANVYFKKNDFKTALATFQRYLEAAPTGEYAQQAREFIVTAKEMIEKNTPSIAGTDWEFCYVAPGQQATRVTFKPDHGVVMSSGDCGNARWTQTGTAVKFDCNNFTAYEMKIDGDEMRGDWVRVKNANERGGSCMRRATTTPSTTPATPATTATTTPPPTKPATDAPPATTIKPTVATKTTASCPAGTHEWAGGCYSCPNGVWLGNGKCGCYPNEHEWDGKCWSCPPGSTWAGMGKCMRWVTK